MTKELPSTAQRPPSVTFWGAAQMVTGSMHLLEAGNAKVLLDCGLHQGRRDESRQRNAHFPFQPNQIDAVLLSHTRTSAAGIGALGRNSGKCRRPKSPVNVSECSLPPGPSATM